MAGTVAPLNMTTVSLCEATTGWSAVGGSIDTNDTAIFDAREGTYCLQNYNAAAVTRGADFTYGTDQTLTDKVIYFWLATSRVSGLPDYGSTGVRIRIEDSSANWAEWDIFGADTLPHGGWICWAVLASSATASRTGGTFPTLTAIRKIGWRSGTVAGKTYIYWDAVRFGEGLQISAGTSGDPGTFDDFIASEATNAYGVVNEYKGIYYVQGKLAIGSATVATYFKDTGKTVVFQDSLVGSSFYDIYSIGNSSFDTEIYFGEKSGTAGISGCTFQKEDASQTAAYTVDLSDANRTKIGLYGSAFRGAGVITLPVYNASYTREALNSVFEACAQLVASTCTITNCNFISAAAEACLVSSIVHRMTACNFINCSRGIHIDTIGTYELHSITYTGSVYDVKNSTAGLVTLEIYGGDTPTYENTGGGSTTIVNNVFITVNVEDSSGAPIENAQVAAYKVSDDTQLMNEDTTALGVAQEGFNYLVDTDIYVKIRKSTTGTTRYYPIYTTGEITGTGFTLTAVMAVDNIVSS